MIQLVNKITVFSGTQQFITRLTLRPHNLAWTQTTSSHSASLKSV